MTPLSTKIFILDTNVVLHDSNCISHFGEHDIVLPIVVLEELDGFKRGEQEIGYHARQFLRSMDALAIGTQFFEEGVPLGAGLGRLWVGLGAEFHADLIHNFAPQKPDHQILNVAYNWAQKHPEREVILVSKDVNLRLKAKAVGLKAEDYNRNRVRNVQSLYTGKRVEEGLESELIERLYEEPHELPISEIPFREGLTPNEYMIMRNGAASALATYDQEAQVVRRVEKTSVYNIRPRNAEQIFALNALLNPEISLVTLSGKAGTGKTLLALSAALEMRKEFSQILLARPIVPLSNRDTGFLPGEIEAKLAPYMQPLYDNLGVIRGQFPKTDSRHKNIQKLMDSDKLVITPLSYIRGRSLVDVYFIVDEAQNLTPHEVKTVITRAGAGTKIVFTGDIFQIDHPYLDTESNGLSYLIEKMKGQHMYAHVNLEKGERSDLADLASDLL